MAAKKSVTFYAAKDVAEWLAGMGEDENVSLRINEAIREGALKSRPQSLFQIPLGFYQMSALLKILKKETAEREKEVDNADQEDLGDDAHEYISEASGLLAHFEQFVKD